MALSGGRQGVEFTSAFGEQRFIALGLGIGWLLGGPDIDTRRVMALGTGQRNIAAALVVASESFSDPKVVVMVIVVAIVGLIILMPLSRALANRLTET